MVSDTPLIDFLVAHWKLAVALLVVCEGFSLCLIARLWLTRRKMGVVRKLAWSVVPLVPLVGRLFFAAFCPVPRRDEHGGHVEHGGAAWGGDFGPGSHHF
jgi:cytochrome b subunit of formate dehydrogenase